jgi:hypothetical protein
LGVVAQAQGEWTALCDWVVRRVRACRAKRVDLSQKGSFFAKNASILIGNNMSTDNHCLTFDACANKVHFQF